MKKLLVSLFLVVGSVASTSGGTIVSGLQPDEPCMGNRTLVGECFTVHARLQMTTGTPGYWMWRVGSNRILGVSEPAFEKDSESPWMPESLLRKLDWDIYMYGDFLVCPVTKERPGAMQTVCIDSVKHLVIKDTRTAGERSKK